MITINILTYINRQCQMDWYEIDVFLNDQFLNEYHYLIAFYIFKSNNREWVDNLNIGVFG